MHSRKALTYSSHLPEPHQKPCSLSAAWSLLLFHHELEGGWTYILGALPNTLSVLHTFVSCFLCLALYLLFSSVWLQAFSKLPLKCHLRHTCNLTFLILKEHTCSLNISKHLLLCKNKYLCSHGLIGSLASGATEQDTHSRTSIHVHATHARQWWVAGVHAWCWHHTSYTVAYLCARVQVYTHVIAHRTLMVHTKKKFSCARWKGDNSELHSGPS
jgi:hypothetical protein